MKPTTTTVALIGLLALSSLAGAQALPPGALEAVRASKLPLLVRNDVAEALDISNLQRSKIKDHLKMPDRPNRQPPSFMRGMMEDMIKGKIREMEGKVLKELTNAQRKRLDEIQLQWKGFTALYDRKVRRDLKISKDQDKQIGQIRKQFERKQPGEGQPGVSEEVRLLKELLTSDQLQRLRALGGETIDWGKPAGDFATLPGGR